MLRLIVSGAFFLLLCLSAQTALAATVFVIESYHAGYDWDTRYLQVLRDRLTPQHTLVTFELDTKRLPEEQHEARAQLAFARYLELKPDLVVLADDNACALLGKRLAETGTPIVYMGINANPRKYGLHSRRDTTGVIERPLIKRAISYLSRMEGLSLSKVLLLFDNSTTAQIIFGEIMRYMPSENIMGVGLETRMIASWKDWQESILQAKSENFDVIIIGLYQTLIGDDGNVANDVQVLEWTIAHAQLPCFAVWNFSVGPGKAIGGLLHSAEEQGDSAADLVLSLLQYGESPVHPVMAEQGQLILSRSGMARWGLKVPRVYESEVNWVP
ncbi:ABC transporter substrate-binding protein [Oleidesulfovibrio sp.]|uniref:ABC transporter substrate-binding protein n=1 Tax=Oleidesulfovibrio sp. TaxID=2909707 RepID=UPI003A887FC8